MYVCMYIYIYIHNVGARGARPSFAAWTPPRARGSAQPRGGGGD